MKNSSLHRYFVLLHRFKSLRSMKVDLYHPAVIGGVIILFLIWFILACLRPLNIQQHTDLTHFAQQQHYPMTRTMALAVLDDAKPNRYQYFRVLRAAHLEQKNIHHQEQIHVEIQRSITDVY